MADYDVVEIDGAADPAISDAWTRAYWRQERLRLESDTVSIIIKGDEAFRCSLCGVLDHIGTFEEHHARYIGPETVCVVCRDCHQRIHHDVGFYDNLKPEVTRSEAKKQKHKPLRGIRGTAKLIQPGEYEVAPRQRVRWCKAK